MNISSMLPVAVTLVLGGARSGKSAMAETLVQACGGRPVYLATATVCDSEMALRIRSHRERRGDDWTTMEEPLEVAKVLMTLPPGVPVLVDCLTIWLTNLMLGGHDVKQYVQSLLETLTHPQGPVVMVANEVGLSIVPDNALARAFRDQAGLLNQAVARVAGRVIFVAAGLPLVLKT